MVIFSMQLNVYFDDFVGAELPPLARLFDLAMQLLLQVLGWDLATDKEPSAVLLNCVGIRNQPQ